MSKKSGNSKSANREITCPKCERVWPRISEQGIVTAQIDQCYQCLIKQVTLARDELIKQADYVVDNCPHCESIPGMREQCIPCGGKGWQIVDKAIANSPIELLH